MNYSRITSKAGMAMKKAPDADFSSPAGCQEELLDPPELGSAEENQDGDYAEESEEDTSSSTSPPPVLAEDTGVNKKRKRVNELASSSSAAADKASVLAGDMEYFDLLES
jgi:hypothetical protein